MTTKPEVRLNITKGPAFTQAANAVSLCVNASLDFNEFRDDVKLQLKEENFSATIGLERSHVLVIGKDGKIIKNKHGFANLLATSPEEIVVEIAEYATAGGESNGHFFRLFSEVILQGKMDCTTDPDIWTLTGEESWGEDEVYSLLIRKDWIKLRESILDESRHFPLCLLLKGKSGRGKSVFLKYLIFFILYEAKNREKCGVYSENESHLYAPLIVYVGRDNKTHYISLEGVFTEWIWHRRNHGKPHYYFSDNVDILSGATMGTRVTMALTSGDAIVMNEFSKRIDDVGGTVAYMPSLTLGEMLKLFATPQQPPQHPPQQSLQHPPQQSPQQPPQQSLQHPAQQSLQHPPQQSPQQPLQQKTEQVPSDFTQAGTASVQKLRRHQYTAEEVQFRFDVIGGNPRRMKDKIFSVARTTHYYKLVSSVVDKVFPDQTAARKRWALNLVCAVLEGAQIIGGKTQTDSSLFREYVVSGAAFTEHEEVFCSTFLGMVAATIEAHKDVLKELSILTLFGASGYGNLFEYQMHQALLAASPEDEYFCWCSDGKNHVSLRLGGGNVKLVRTINDLTTLTVGSYAMPTIPNYAIVDSVRVTEHTLTTGWLFRHRSVTTTRKIGINATIGDRHDGKVTKLPALLEALGTTEDNFWIVYVLPLNTIHTFKFPTNLGAVKLFVTASHPTTEAAMRGAMTSRKRKLSWW